MDFLIGVGLCVEATVPEPLHEWVIDYCMTAYMVTPQLKQLRARKKARQKAEAIARTRRSQKVVLNETSRPGKCRYCRRNLYWHRMSSGKMIPVDPDGTVHFDTCEYQQGPVRER